MANRTSIIRKRHLVDSLLLRKVNIVKIFGAEHGFRGNASAKSKEHTFLIRTFFVILLHKLSTHEKNTYPMRSYPFISCM